MADAHLASLKKRLQRHLGCSAQDLDQYWQRLLPLAEQMADQTQPAVLGISGAQGCGKSTMALAIRFILQRYFDVKTAILSLDDLYYGRQHRQWLANNIHPLFQTRGVPGTHDVALGLELIRRFRAGRGMFFPRFDKSRDDRHPFTEYLSGPVGVLIVEGWCLGATPQATSELNEPINELEREFDADGRWRRCVNHQLSRQYPHLFRQLDKLIFLQAPDWQQVCQWRWQQEQRNQALNEQQMAHFMAHYERLTRHMLVNPPTQAQQVWRLDQQRQIFL